MDRKIALVAWNYLDKFDVFEEARILKFLQEHVNSSNAPEPRGMWLLLLAKIYIKPKSTVKDPQGNIIQSSLKDLGFLNIENVNMGKYLEIKLDTDNESTASEDIKKMCDQILTNPLIEDYSFVIEKI